MVKPLPKKKDDDMHFHNVVVNPKHPAPPISTSRQVKFKDRYHQLGVCNRCAAKVEFEKKEKGFIKRKLMAHLNQFHGEGPFNTLDQEFTLVGVDDLLRS